MITTQEITTGAAHLAQWSAGGTAAVGKSVKGSAGTGCARVMRSVMMVTHSQTTDAARVAVWRMGTLVQELGHTGSVEDWGTSASQDAERAGCHREHRSNVMTGTSLQGMGAARDAGLSADGIAVEGICCHLQIALQQPVVTGHWVGMRSVMMVTIKTGTGARLDAQLNVGTRAFTMMCHHTHAGHTQTDAHPFVETVCWWGVRWSRQGTVMMGM